MSEADDQTVLVSAKVFSNDGLKIVRSILLDLKEVLEMDRISSVYRVQGENQKPKHVHDLRRYSSFEGLAFCVAGQSRVKPVELIEYVEQLERSLRNEIMRRSASFNILAFGSLTFMTPGLTLPHPEFHLEAEQIIPAAEIWPDWIHPVLNQPLKALSGNLMTQNVVEFFTQGKTLLDF